MNKEGEEVKRTQCPKCILSMYSPACMWQKNGKCDYFKDYSQNTGKVTK